MNFGFVVSKAVYMPDRFGGRFSLVAALKAVLRKRGWCERNPDSTLLSSQRSLPSISLPLSDRGRHRGRRVKGYDGLENRRDVPYKGKGALSIRDDRAGRW
jgi:hypothetical protein